jgi:hypothetical protein
MGSICTDQYFIARDIPIPPAGFSNMGDMVGFAAHPPGDGNEIDGETLVDQKSHDIAIAASRCRDRGKRATSSSKFFLTMQL